MRNLECEDHDRNFGKFRDFVERAKNVFQKLGG